MLVPSNYLQKLDGAPHLINDLVLDLKDRGHKVTVLTV